MQSGFLIAHDTLHIPAFPLAEQNWKLDLTYESQATIVLIMVSYGVFSEIKWYMYSHEELFIIFSRLYTK